VSWLFVAVIPGLLMLVTFGLDRLESRLGRGCVGASDVAEFLAQAQPSDVTTLARDGIGEALDCFQRRRMDRIDPARELANYSHIRPRHVHAGPNPQFRPTRHADSV
jgi:hypothetical protein